MKILIVEDEEKTGNYLKQSLIESGFTVDLAITGLDGLHLATSDQYDLFIFDVMLPEIDGWQLVKTLRSHSNQTPVLLLSALGRPDDKIKGLELGADDYLAKPFVFSELLARVRSLLRRGQQQIRQTQFIVGDLYVDLLKRKVTRAGKRIELSSKEFALLEFFLRHQGEVLTRSLIASQVWDINFDSDTNVIDVSVKRLRDKIDTATDKKLIHTVRGMGYILELKDE